MPQLVLEDWFKNDPVNQVVMLEEAIALQQDNLAKEEEEAEAENDNEQNEAERDNSEDAPPAESIEYSLPKCNDAQHVVIVHNEIHSSSCVLYYLECSNNRPEEASKLEIAPSPPPGILR